MQATCDQKPHVDSERVCHHHHHPRGEAACALAADDGAERPVGEAGGCLKLRNGDPEVIADDSETLANVATQAERRLVDQVPFRVVRGRCFLGHPRSALRGFLASLRLSSLSDAHGMRLRLQELEPHPWKRGLSRQQLGRGRKTRALSGWRRLKSSRFHREGRIPTLKLSGCQVPHVGVSENLRHSHQKLDARASLSTAAEHTEERSAGEPRFFLKLTDREAEYLGEGLDPASDPIGERSGFRARRVAVEVANEAEGVFFRSSSSGHDRHRGHLPAWMPAARANSGSTLPISP